MKHFLREVLFYFYSLAETSDVNGCLLGTRRRVDTQTGVLLCIQQTTCIQIVFGLNLDKRDYGKTVTGCSHSRDIAAGCMHE